MKTLLGDPAKYTIEKEVLSHSIPLRGARQVLTLLRPNLVSGAALTFSNLEIIEDGSVFIKDGKIALRWFSPVSLTGKSEGDCLGYLKFRCKTGIVMPGLSILKSS